MQEESPPPLVGCSKPHLEKLTLGITRILGEWGGVPGRGPGAGGTAAGPSSLTLETRHRCCDFRC